MLGFVSILFKSIANRKLKLYFISEGTLIILIKNKDTFSVQEINLLLSNNLIVL